MPVNLLDIQNKLIDFSTQARMQKERMSALQHEISSLVETYANNQDELKDRFDKAAEQIPRLRCAIPGDELLNTSNPCQNLENHVTVIAADGSQINPSRHAQVGFCVINVAVVKMERGSGHAPKILTRSQLLDFDDVFLPTGGMLSEGMVALKRDLQEREAILELAANLQSPAVSMTDGPLELYREPQDISGFNQTLANYQEILTRLKNTGLMTLGYIDKPGADLVVRLLELMQMEDEQIASYNKRQRRFAGVSDAYLFSTILQNPGERSAVFGIHSEIARRFVNELTLHFFYLNVGLPGRPHLARVEIPGWVANDKTCIDTIQSVLVEQAAMLGTRPYPYILHRAHEEAVVTRPESNHVEELIVQAFDRAGITADEKSYKQYHKDLPTKKNEV